MQRQIRRYAAKNTRDDTSTGASPQGALERITRSAQGPFPNWSFSAFLPLALLVSGCSTEPPPSEEHIASVASPSWGGTIDSNEEFPQVVAFVDADGNAVCSGTLITPQWILSAMHCLEAGTPLYANLNFRFGFDHQGLAVAHTYNSLDPTTAISSPSKDPLGNLANNSEAARDIILIKLDSAISKNDIIPMRPTLSTESCGSSFDDGVIVGYGSDLVQEGCGTQTDVRRFRDNAGWSRLDGAPNGSLFQRESSLENYCATYDGTAHGDSGGPLIRKDAVTGEKTLCGVTSNSTKDASFDHQRKAAVDSPEVISWMLGQILGVPGGCGVADASNDPDGDGIPSLCDNCPTVWNPEQLDGDDDVVDKDGVGAACDFCPEDTLADQTANCNFEAELASASKTLNIPNNPFVGQPVIPVLRRDAFNSKEEFEQQKQILLKSFKPDRCDPIPCPDHLLTSNQGELPSYPQIIPQDCPPGKQCRWDIHNRIVLTPTPTPKLLTDSAGGVAGKMGLRWCWCNDDLVSTETASGRIKCQKLLSFKCELDAQLYMSATSAWVPINTWNIIDGSTSSTGIEWNMIFHANPLDKDVWWDFLQLDGMYGVNAQNKNTGTRGVLWSHISQLDSPPPSFTEAQAKNLGNIYGEGNASRSYVVSSGPPLSIDYWEAIYCPECPLRYSNLVISRGDPEPYQLMVQGLDKARKLSTDSRNFYALVASEQVSYVRAAEPLGRLAQATFPSTLVRGVAVDPDGRVTSVLKSVGFDEGPVASRFTPEGGPIIGRDQGVVMSGALKRLFVFGGTNRGTPNETAWTLDLGTGSWKEYPVPLDERPGSIPAATFRLDDQRVYFLDWSGSTLRLCRFRSSAAQIESGVEVLARLPTAWSDYSRFSLVAGAEGDLLFAASDHLSDPSKDTLLARFSVSRKGKLGFLGRAYRSSPLIGEPVLTAAGIAIGIPAPSGAILKAVALSALDPSPTDAPTLL